MPGSGHAGGRGGHYLSGTYIITDADIAAGTVANTAFAQAGDGSTSGQNTVTIYEKSIHLDAQTTPNAYAQVGKSIAYTFTITGHSAVPLQGDPIVIADPLQITCETLDTIGNGDISLTVMRRLHATLRRL